MEHPGTIRADARPDGHDFHFDLRGVAVTCCISDAAIDQWVAAGRCERSDFRRILRLVTELVTPQLRQANAAEGERWIARVGPDSVGLALAD